jgi:hypothetical protein
LGRKEQPSVTTPTFFARVVGAVGICALLTLSIPAVDASGADLAKVRSFSAFHVYFAGHSTTSLPLESVLKEPLRGGGRSTSWTFFYGKCGSWSEGLCSVPLQIQDYSTCRRWADAYPGKPHLFAFRGAKAAWVGTAGSFEVYTGRTTVVIFARSRRVAWVAAQRLRDVNSTKPSRLPPPTPGSLWGRLPCQGEPG